MNISRTVWFVGIFICFFLHFEENMYAQQVEQIPRFTNPVTFEREIGVTGIPDEYLIVWRNFKFDVALNGDIYIFDEYKVKIFDRNGKPKAIFGQRGQGPGDFEGDIRRDDFKIDISPKGFLTICEYQFLNVFSPLNRLLKKERYYNIPGMELFGLSASSFSPASINLYSIIALNEKEMIIEGDNAYYTNRKGPYKERIVYVKDGAVTTIAEYDLVNFLPYFESERSYTRSSLMGLGFLLFTVLPDNRILYTHTYHDAKILSKQGIITIHLSSLDGTLKKDFDVTYELMDFDKAQIEDLKNSRSPQQREVHKLLLKYAQERKYQAINMGNGDILMVDGETLFIGISPSRYENKQLFEVYKVINLQTCKVIGEVDFLHPKGGSSFSSDFLIRNGNLYLAYRPYDRPSIRADNPFPSIRIYRIDPQVYGK